MTPEEVARRYERKPGYDLIDYSPAVLPVYRLTVDAVTMFHRGLSPIKEFVLRSIAAGLCTEGQISGFLGLDEATVRATLDQARRERYVDEKAEGSFFLSARGTDVLLQARESAPRDEMLVFLYDRLLKRPVRLVGDDLLVPSQVDTKKVIEVRPYPAEGPEIHDLSMSEVSIVLQEQVGGSPEFGRDLLKLKRIAKRMRMFRPATLLVYKKKRSSDIVVEFVVDDVKHEGLSHAFAVSGGAKKMGFVKSIDESSTANELRRYLGSEVVRLLPDGKALEECRLAVSIASIKYQTAIAQSARDLEPDHAGMSDAAKDALIKLTSAQSDIRAFPARPLAAFEVAEYFDAALAPGHRVLFISSQTVDRSIVTTAFLKKLEYLLANGARVVIALSDSAGTDGPALDLERLRSRYPKLELLSGRRGQFHYLVCDDEFAIVTNRPLLSNSSKVRTLQHVVGYVLQRKDLVRAFVDGKIRDGNHQSKSIMTDRNSPAET